MIVQVDEELAVLAKALVEPSTVLGVEGDGFVAHGGLQLAHPLMLSA
jgi:hypothetical protein